MPWLRSGEIARALGVSRHAIKNRGRRGTLERKRDTDGKRWLYWLDGEPATPDPDPDGRPASLQIEDKGASLIQRDGYVYDPERRLYVIPVASQRQPLILHRERVEAIWTLYAGHNGTIAEVCRKFGLSRKLFGEIKRALGLTKTRAPWTDETLEESSEDDLIADGMRLKEQSVLAGIERKEWAQIKRIASHRRWIAEVVKDVLGSPPPAPQPRPAVATPASMRGEALVVGWTDIHIGKRPHGEQGDLRRQEGELRELIERALDRARRIGPERIYCPIGSDLLHADTLGLTTTKGTAQGAQSVGSIRQHLALAIDLTCDLIGRLGEIAPVTAFSLAGNHDETLSFAVALAVERAFWDSKSVHVDVSERRRRVFGWGKAPIYFDHGDKIKDRDLPLMIAADCPEGCDARLATVFRGHTHTASTTCHGHQEVGGYDVVRMASPSDTDDWHHEHLYDLNRRRLTLAVVNALHGLDRVEWARV